jgi:hypothetical protein
MIHPASVFQRVKVVLPPDLVPVYSNAALVRYSAGEINIDFARLLPGVPRPKVDIRVSMTPFNATLLRDALKDRLLKHERDYGVVRLSCDADPEDTDQGSSGPSKNPPMLPPPRADNAGGQQPAPAPTGQQVNIPSDLEVTHSSFAVVRSSAVDVVVDFACLLPNVFKTYVCARVIVSPAGAKLLLQTLAGALARYEDKYGRIRPPENIGGDERSTYLQLWGPPVPFALN